MKDMHGTKQKVNPRAVVMHGPKSILNSSLSAGRSSRFFAFEILVQIELVELQTLTGKKVKVAHLKRNAFWDVVLLTLFVSDDIMIVSSYRSTSREGYHCSFSREQQIYACQDAPLAFSAE